MDKRWSALATEVATHIPGSNRKCVASRSTDAIICAPLFSSCKTTSRVASSLGSPVWHRQQGDTKMVRRRSTRCIRKDESMAFVQPGEKVKGRGNITADFSYLMSSYREDRQTFQTCTTKGWEVTDISWNNGNSDWRKKTQWGCQWGSTIGMDDQKGCRIAVLGDTHLDNAWASGSNLSSMVLSGRLLEALPAQMVLFNLNLSFRSRNTFYYIYLFSLFPLVIILYLEVKALLLNY